MKRATSQQAPAADWLERFEPYAAEFFDRHEVPGAAVAIVHAGEVVYRAAFGVRDRVGSARVTPETRFGIASLTKSFTALTLLALEARGLLSLEDAVTDHLPEFAYPGLGQNEPVRLYHLASHTSGLPPLRALDFAIHPSQIGDPAEAFNHRDYSGAPRVDDTEALLAYLRRGERAALAAPGKVVSYSNEGFALLGAVIERATGLNLEEAMRREVFDPLGMEGATFDLSAAQAGGQLTGLFTRVPNGSAPEEKGSVIASPHWEEAPAYLATGFLKASVNDLTRSLAYLMGGGDEHLPVRPARISELWKPHGWVAPGSDYALGWSVRHDYHGLRIIRHGGSLKGVSSHQGWVPGLDLGIAILTNLDEVPVSHLFIAAVNAALGAPLDRAAYEANEATPAPAALAGMYASGEPWGRLELRPDDASGALVAFAGEQLNESGTVTMLNDREFVLVGPEGAWDGGRFHYDAAGRPTAVQYGSRWYDREGP